jgi:hypothetical protein
VSPSYPVNSALVTIAFVMLLAGKQFESIARFKMAGQSADCQPHLPLHHQRPSFERVGMGIGDRRRPPLLLDYRRFLTARQAGSRWHERQYRQAGAGGQPRAAITLSQSGNV